MKQTKNVKGKKRNVNYKYFVIRNFPNDILQSYSLDILNLSVSFLI